MTETPHLTDWKDHAFGCVRATPDIWSAHRFMLHMEPNPHRGGGRLYAVAQIDGDEISVSLNESITLSG